MWTLCSLNYIESGDQNVESVLEPRTSLQIAVLHPQIRHMQSFDWGLNIVAQFDLSGSNYISQFNQNEPGNHVLLKKVARWKDL